MTSQLIQDIRIREEYVCISDIAKKGDGESWRIISNWMRTYSTLDFLIFWETINNKFFNVDEAKSLLSRAGRPDFAMSPQRWIEETQATGIYSKRGRNGGAWAHRDIAFEFASFISAKFRFVLITEYQRLREKQEKKEIWSYGRFLSKVNYHLHTQAIKETILPRLDKQGKDKGFVYADEADMLNLIVFGMTAREWKEANPDLTGNARDHASLLELSVLGNLESLNSVMIKKGSSQEARYHLLLDTARDQFRRLADGPEGNIMLIQPNGLD